MSEQTHGLKKYLKQIKEKEIQAIFHIILLLCCPLYLGIFLLSIEKQIQITSISIQTWWYITTNLATCNRDTPASYTVPTVAQML